MMRAFTTLTLAATLGPIGPSRGGFSGLQGGPRSDFQ